MCILDLFGFGCFWVLLENKVYLFCSKMAYGPDPDDLSSMS